jgi:predicted ATPase
MADIEGSTRLWEERPGEMAAALASIDVLLAHLVDAHRGVRPVEQGEGDSFVMAFVRASDAVACAVALQRDAPPPIRLRIGVHTGETQLRDAGNYMGPTINRAARLRDLAHGGQTLLSGATTDLVCELLPERAWLVDFGRVSLRDVARLERVSQLCHPDLRNAFPPLRACRSGDGPWQPAHLTPFVGRVRELADVRRLLERDRLVTLTGVGGVGKTRLAMQAADGLARRYGDGVVFVDLAPVTEPRLVTRAAARALALPALPDRDGAVDALTRHLGERTLLLVVDNCEHVLGASAALIDGVLRSCPNVTVLATSREPVAVTGERLWRVPPMSLHRDAIALFTECAQRACSDFRLDPRDTGVVREICRRLDGVPLAIELAAGRVRSMSLDEIVDGVQDRFRFLIGGPRTTARRHRTLEASVDWSYDLLSEPEKVAIARLSVFPDAFDADAAAAMVGDGHHVVDLLASLVDRSLVTVESRCGRTRYRLPETIRQYGLARHLDASLHGGAPRLQPGHGQPER